MGRGVRGVTGKTSSTAAGVAGAKKVKIEICSIEGCTDKAYGQPQLWRDQWGQPGVRCITHGGNLVCNVLGCGKTMSQICTKNDNWGIKGPRCSEHLVQLATDSVAHHALDHYADAQKGTTAAAPLVDASAEQIVSAGKGKTKPKQNVFYDSEGKAVRPRNFTKPLLVTKKMDEQPKCGAPNCRGFAKGDKKTAADEYGLPGFRCEQHGGYICCGVEGCKNPRWIIGTRADAWGKRGPRCSEHSQPVASGAFLQKKVNPDGENTVATELPRRTPKAENPGGGILPPAASPTAYGGPPKILPPPPAPEINVNEIAPPQRNDIYFGPYLVPQVSPSLIDELAGCCPKAGKRKSYPRFRASKTNPVSNFEAYAAVLDDETPAKVKTVSGTRAPLKRGRSKTETASNPLPIMNGMDAIVSAKAVPMKRKRGDPLVSKVMNPISDSKTLHIIGSDVQCNIDGCREMSAGAPLLCEDEFGAAGPRCTDHGGFIGCCVPNCFRPMFTFAGKGDQYGTIGPRCTGHSSAKATKEVLKNLTTTSAPPKEEPLPIAAPEKVKRVKVRNNVLPVV